MDQIPFVIKRTYWVYDVPGGQMRDGHAYHNNAEVIVALSGSFDVTVDDGRQKKHFCLNRSSYGLYVPAGTWRTIENFSTNAFEMVLASEHYDQDDYILDYNQFLNVTKAYERE